MEHVERHLALPGALVIKSNAFARARWPIDSIYESRLVALAISRVRQEDEEFQAYEIPDKDILGSERGGFACDLLEKVVDNIFARVVTIREKNGWSKYSMFSRCVYNKDKRTLEAKFHPDLRPHLLGLQRYFTKYELMEFYTLKSVQTQRLFEILCSWSDKPEVTLNLDELFEQLATSGYLKERFPDFRRRVLNVAHKQINASTSLSYAWEPVKQGRKVVAIRFIFSKPRQSEAEAKAKGEQDQRESTAKNTLFLAATKCLQEQGGTCKEPEGKKECSLCLS